MIRISFVPLLGNTKENHQMQCFIKKSLNFNDIELNNVHINKDIMNLTLKIWRQKNAQDKGAMVNYQVLMISQNICLF